jgi:hypothetical protein
MASKNDVQAMSILGNLSGGYFRMSDWEKVKRWSNQNHARSQICGPVKTLGESPTTCKRTELMIDR